MKADWYDYMDWPRLEGILYAEEDLPHEVLGAREVEGKVLVTCFFPDALSVELVLTSTKKCVPMADAEDGFFAVMLERKRVPEYTYLVEYKEGTVEMPEIYNQKPVYKESDYIRFTNGIDYQVYLKLGAHVKKLGETEGVLFSVWAPNALSVSVVGDFNFWDGRRHLMRRIGESGVFELFIPGIVETDIYKYEIHTRGGATVLKSDPYGFCTQKRPDTASIVWNIEDYEWQDQVWMKERKGKSVEKEPMLIYEVHLGSFMQQEGEFLNYRELAEKVAAHCKKLNMTHVELMPVMEHPLDESWGYQVTGYFAPTSRYGTPQDFMYFVDRMHEEGIGVLLDWVPAHFPKDEHGLARFDGTCLYEHLDPRQGEHPHWGTLIYNYGRPQVSNFLIANALFWLEKYHVDGLRLDAVASMLYLDYGKNQGEWVANIYGGNENLEAVELLKHLNSIIKKRKDGSIIIAEESTSWPKVTGELSDGSLGFDLKWNMGWMNDYLEYIKTDPLFRKGRHGMLTFSMIYQYSEQFILVLSHDEVVHGKGSLYGKMPGTAEEKIAGLRLSYGFMAAHPGKKLLFMGQEFGQKTEWAEGVELPWEQAKEEGHAELMDYVGNLYGFYKEHPALYAEDDEPESFEWISELDADHSVISFLRKSKEETLLIVCNFTPVAYEKFLIGVPFVGKYKEVFNSDAACFGGSDFVNPRVKTSKAVKCDGRENSIEFKLAGLGISIFSCGKEKK